MDWPALLICYHSTGSTCRSQRTTTQRTAALGGGACSVPPVRRDPLDAALSQCLVERISVVGPISDVPRGHLIYEAGIEGGDDEGNLLRHSRERAAADCVPIVRHGRARVMLLRGHCGKEPIKEVHAGHEDAPATSPHGAACRRRVRRRLTCSTSRITHLQITHLGAPVVVRGAAPVHSLARGAPTVPQKESGCANEPSLACDYLKEALP